MMQKKVFINEKYRKDKSLTQLVNDLPGLFASETGELLFKMRNEVRRIVLTSGLTVIAKRYRRPNFFQKLSYSTFWTNKAVKSFRYASRLQAMGIATPEAVAAVVYKQDGLIKEYFFISTEDTGNDCLDVLMDGTEGERKQLTHDLAALLVTMHEKGFMHGDLNLTNILCHKVGSGYSLSVIDTNRSRFLGRPATATECMKNMMRLTHDRQLMQQIVREYCQQIGWSYDTTYTGIHSALKRFERKKQVLGSLKKLLKR